MTRRTPSESVVGKLLLELIALAAFWLILSVSRFESGTTDVGRDAGHDSPTEFGAMIAGLVTDQLERHGIQPGR